MSRSSLHRPQSLLLIIFAKKQKTKFAYLCTVKTFYSIVTRKQLSVCFFFDASLFLDSKDLMKCLINLVLSLGVSCCSFATFQYHHAYTWTIMQIAQVTINWENRKCDQMYSFERTPRWNNVTTYPIIIISPINKSLL